MKLSKKVIIIIAVVLVCLVGGGIAFATNTPTARAERQLNLGNKYLQEGKYQEAILAFQKVIEIEPKNISARLGLGKAYVATNQFDKAEIVLKEVIDIDSNNIPAREELFNVYVKEGNLEAANVILKEITALDPQKDMSQYSTDLDLAKAISTSKVSYELGIKQMNDKQYLEAIDSFQKVIKEDTERYDNAQTKISDCKKTFIEVTIQKAKDAAAKKDYQSALDLLEQVLKIDANNEEALKLKSEFTSALQEQKQKEDTGNLSENFIHYASLGMIPEAGYAIGTPIKTIKDSLGTPDEEQYRGWNMEWFRYGNIVFEYEYYKDFSKEIKNDVNTIGVYSIIVRRPLKAFGIELGKTKLNELDNLLGNVIISAPVDHPFMGYNRSCKVSNHTVYFIGNQTDGIIYACRIY